MLALNLFSLFALPVAHRGWFGLQDNSSGAGEGRPRSSNAPQDHLGSIRVLTDEDGGVTERTSWGPWGERFEGGERSRMGYTGHQIDAESGLHHAVHRYLDPRNGRWTQRDPLGDVDGQNIYRYATNDPTNRVDVLGLHASHQFQGTVDPKLSLFASGSAFVDAVGHFKYSVIATAGTESAEDKYDFIQVVRALWNGEPVPPTGGEGFSVGPAEWELIKTPDGFSVDTADFSRSPYFHSVWEGQFNQCGNILSDPSGLRNYVRGLAPWSYNFEAVTIAVSTCGSGSNPKKVNAIAGFRWGYSFTWPDQIRVTNFRPIISIPMKFKEALLKYPGGSGYEIDESFMK